MKFYCSDCGKLYQKCKCRVYMSAYRFGRTDPLPSHPKPPKDGKEGVPNSTVEA